MQKETKNVRVDLDTHKALSNYAKKHDRKVQNLACQVILLGLKKLEELESKRR